MSIYFAVEFISGFMVGMELIDDEDEKIGYFIVDLGIIRLNVNWDKK